MTSIMTLCGIIKHCVNSYLDSEGEVRLSVAESWIFTAVEEAGYFDHFYQTRALHSGSYSMVEDVELVEPPQVFSEAVNHGFNLADRYFLAHGPTDARTRHDVAQALYSILLDGEFIQPDAKTEFAAEHER